MANRLCRKEKYMDVDIFKTIHPYYLSSLKDWQPCEIAITPISVTRTHLLHRWQSLINRVLYYRVRQWCQSLINRVSCYQQEKEMFPFIYHDKLRYVKPLYLDIHARPSSVRFWKHHISKQQQNWLIARCKYKNSYLGTTQVQECEIS
jgi:hypothetical protein